MSHRILQPQITWTKADSWAQSERAESPKDNSPGQSESASDALGKSSTKFLSPERAAHPSDIERLENGHWNKRKRAYLRRA